MTACSVKGCKKSIKSKGMCQMHYFRMWRHGTLVPKVEHRPGGRGICTIIDCGKPDAGHHGLCDKHHNRLKRNGDPLRLLGPRPVKGPDHPYWQGDDIGYGAMHCRLRSHRGPASAHACVDCGKPAQQWAYDHNDPDQVIQTEGYGEGCPYSTKMEHYEPKCIPCHKVSDLRRLGKSVR